MKYYLFVAIVAIIGYLLGSINSAVILSKVIYKQDIRTQGSGNAGMTNMNRVYGKKAALFTFLGDFCKGIAAVLIGRLVFDLAGFDDSQGACIAGALSVIGHNWPVYFGFKGGKGVLTSFSVLLVITPIPALIVFAFFVILVAITKYVSLGSITGSFALPVMVFFAGDYLLTKSGFTEVFCLCAFVAILIIARHHGNIKRLIKGQESKLSLKK